MKIIHALFISLLVSALFIGCQSSTDKIEVDENEVEVYSSSREFDLQGHRGARGLFPENSIEGFIGAVELQVNTVEMDVVISKDHEVVVSHEPWMSSVICWGINDKPVPEGEGLKLYDLTYEQISNFNCGSQPHPNFPLQAKFATFKPLLSEVIAEVEAATAELELESVLYNIEIKSTPEGDGIFHPAPKEFCKLVLEVIREGDILNRTIIQSFDVRSLQAMKQLDSSISLALLIEESEGFEADIAKLGFAPAIYSPNFSLVNEELVRACHDKDIRIIPWTVNEEEDMVRLLDLGVDGIITDYPDVALTLKL
ncbi:MAG: glycerophosphodiester phosphodiesterase [Flavobacteriales bacterium]|nr:glycerophosphodiester phosphodiesterase [Flavobacteriales bacterium]